MGRNFLPSPGLHCNRNPTAVFIRSFRATTYNGTAPNWSDVGYLAVISIVSLAIGLATFKKLSRRLAEEL